MFPRIKIFAFGALQVERAGRQVSESDWHTRQARQLLKILITERPRAVSADRLIELLWPHSSPDAAATTLRSAVNALRNVLEPERPNRAPSCYIITQTPGYAFRLTEDLWLDVEVFERELEAARQQAEPARRRRQLEAATALYSDDYLISDPYADWAQNERQRLQELYFRALLDLAELQAMSGDAQAAINACRQLLARDNVREPAYQALMRYQAGSGDSAGALITFERCRTILAEELGADPSPLTQTLHQRILNGEIAGPVEDAPLHLARLPTAAALSGLDAVPDALELPQRVLMPTLEGHFTNVFVGREREISLLETRLYNAFDGRGDLVVLEGEAGVGKTRLAFPMLQQAADSGATVLSVTCQALEQQLPFAPLADCLGRYLRSLPEASLSQLPATSLAHLAQIVPSLHDRLPGLPAPILDAALGVEEKRQRLVDAMLAFVTTVARARPLVLFLDDLQWADPDTLAVLGRLAQWVADEPLFVLLAYRTDDLPENEALGVLLHTLKRTARHHVVAVSRLNPPDVQRMVHELTGQQDETSNDLAAFLYDATQGNALFLTEAVRDLLERQQAAAPDDRSVSRLLDVWSSEFRDMLPLRRNQRVQEVILERLERLPEAARAVLQVAAAIGRDFSLELLEATAAGDPESGLHDLLERKFLVERVDERLDFSHQVVRQVAYDDLNALQRRRLHLRIAAALKTLGRAEENPRESAFHFGLAGPSVQQPFAYYSVLAGERLLHSFGFRQAIAHFDDALAVFQGQPDSPPDLVRRALQGRALAYESLLDPEGVAEAYWRLQQWAARQGDRELRLAAYGRLTSMLALLGQQRESNQLMEELLIALAASGDAGRSLVIGDLLARRRRIYSMEEPVANDDGWDVPYVVPPPVTPEPVQDLLNALEPTYAVLALLDYGWTLRIQGQLAEATHCLEAAVELARQTAQPSIAGKAYHQLAVIARLLGNLGQSHLFNEQSIQINQEAPGVGAELSSLWPRIASAYLALQANRIDEAERRLQRVLAVLDGRNGFDTYRTSARIGLGLVALARGHLTDAREMLEAAVAETGSLYPYTHVRALLGLARLAHRQDDTAAAAAYLRRALRYAGTRSLLEEYTETVLEIAALRPAGAPVDDLLRNTLTYVEPLGLAAFAVALRTALAEVSPTYSAPVR
jgi:DNA-binding SARP family transcriptional activator